MRILKVSLSRVVPPLGFLVLVVAVACGSAGAPVPLHESPVSAFVPLPAGHANLGFPSLDSIETHEAEAPRRKFVPAFEIGAVPVTFAEYADFLNSDAAKAFEIRDLWFESDVSPYYLSGIVYQNNRFETREGVAESPAVMVTCIGADAYCVWRSSADANWSYRLPTEWEWERAARGFDGRVWPWGNTEPTMDDGWGWRWTTQVRGNHWQMIPVGSCPKNATPEGVYDLMAYGMWEWCSVDGDELTEIAVLESSAPLRPARGGSKKRSKDISMFEAFMSELHHPGRSWTRWAFAERHRGGLFGFRLVRESK